MPFFIVRDDITKMQCDAIVNPTNEDLIPGGSLDQKIHDAAGEELLAAARKFAPLPIGDARPTPAFGLPCRYVIHTNGPIFRKNSDREEALLGDCYRHALTVAEGLHCESIAIPLISSGTNGFPKELALTVAKYEIERFLTLSDMTVYLVVYEKTEYEISRSLFRHVSSYLDENATDTLANCAAYIPKARQERAATNRHAIMDFNIMPQDEDSLEARLKKLDRSFAETLFAMIDERGITDVECYKRSNVDKKTFSKIKCNPDYRPSKITVVSFAIGLRLTPEEANRLLATVGMTLSHSYRFDVIIEYFLSTGAYRSIHDVNTVLFEFDEPLLGVAC